MKSRQETTSLGQIVTVMAKPTISNKHFINTDTRRFKIQMGDMGPAPGRASPGAGFLKVLIINGPGKLF